MKYLLFLPLLLMGILPLPTIAQDPTITEWNIPWEGRPGYPHVGPDGTIWFVGQQGDYIGSLDPENGSLKQQITLDEGTIPHTVVIDEDNFMWYTGSRSTHIGMIDQVTSEVFKIHLPDERAFDPHSIAFDDDGNIWFTVQAGNFIGMVDIEPNNKTTVVLFEVPTDSARPYGIINLDGIIWAALFGSNKLVRIDPKDLSLTEIPLPRAEASPRRLVADSNGAIWYTDHDNGKIGKFEPESRSVKEWDTPSGADSRPYGIAVDSKDRIWFTETSMKPNRLWGFNPTSEKFFSSSELRGEIQDGTTVRHIIYDATKNRLWFGTGRGNTIGRADLPE
jgi:virginiamycin B lyase